MNERIKELIEQSGLVHGGYANGTNIMTWRESFDNPGALEKFAELIVSESAQYIEDKFDFCGDELIIAEKLLEHFGVES